MNFHNFIENIQFSGRKNVDNFINQENTKKKKGLGANICAFDR